MQSTKSAHDRYVRWLIFAITLQIATWIVNAFTQTAYRRARAEMADEELIERLTEGKLSAGGYIALMEAIRRSKIKMTERR